MPSDMKKIRFYAGAVPASSRAPSIIGTMANRVVITGMGVVSPNGVGNMAFCRAVLEGKSGVRRITRFDTSELPVHIAGEIPADQFDDTKWVDVNQRKHVSRAVPLAIAATAEALRDGRIPTQGISIDEQRQIGIVLGTGGGAQDFSEEQYKLWLEGNIKKVSLFSIPSGTMGTMSSEVSMAFGLRGMSHVVTTGCTSSTDAIGHALRQLQAGGPGVPKVILSGGVDSP